jgi:hypothetical protein
LTEREFTKILDWPGYCVYRFEIDEKTRTLKLWYGGSVAIRS